MRQRPVVLRTRSSSHTSSGWDEETQPNVDDKREAWVQELWQRLDRDGSMSITRDELECEEFYGVLRSVIAPSSANQGIGGAVHGRTQLNMREAVDFCMRKADQNSDKSLGFFEFRSLLLYLHEAAQAGGQSSALLAFSLFDLDASLSIDRDEFQEVLRFFLGRRPTKQEFDTEWLLIAGLNSGDQVTQRQYLRWLEVSQASGVRERFGNQPLATPKNGGKSITNGDWHHRQKPCWNQRFSSGPNPGHMNEARPRGKREFFSRSQSVPELKAFYETFPETFAKQRARLEEPPPSPPRCALWPKSLSTEGGTPLTLPTRHEPRGTMRNHETGSPEQWDGHWSYPVRLRLRHSPGDRPCAPRALFGELTDSFALARKGAGVRPEKLQNRRSNVRVAGGQPLGAKVPSGEVGKVKPARDTVLAADPW